MSKFYFNFCYLSFYWIRIFNLKMSCFRDCKYAESSRVRATQWSWLIWTSFASLLLDTLWVLISGSSCPTSLMMIQSLWSSTRWEQGSYRMVIVEAQQYLTKPNHCIWPIRTHYTFLSTNEQFAPNEDDLAMVRQPSTITILYTWSLDGWD